MEQMQSQAPSFESVWALLQETAKSLKEAEQERREAEQERKASSADFDRRMAESSADFDRRMAESSADFDRKMAESSADFDRRMKASNAEYERRIKRIDELTGSWANNHGSFAEEYFFNAFENGKQNFFGEYFDVIQKNLKNFWQGLEDEYDIVLYNHSSVAIIEVKYKAHTDNIPKVLKKADTFRILFPNYKDFNIYLGLASMSFPANVEEECINQGVAVIKQVGEAVVINDTNLKVF